MNTPLPKGGATSRPWGLTKECPQSVRFHRISTLVGKELRKLDWSPDQSGIRLSTNVRPLLRAQVIADVEALLSFEHDPVLYKRGFNELTDSECLSSMPEQKLLPPTTSCFLQRASRRACSTADNCSCDRPRHRPCIVHHRSKKCADVWQQESFYKSQL